ncbi:unnamed protein product, partial [Polarella glacialis]
VTTISLWDTMLPLLGSEDSSVVVDFMNLDIEGHGGQVLEGFFAGAARNRPERQIHISAIALEARRDS